MLSLLGRGSGSCFLVQNGFHTGRVAARGAQLRRVFQLAGGLLKAQVELLFFQICQLFTQLVRRFVMQFLGVHRPFPFNITSRPRKSVTLIPVEFMMRGPYRRLAAPWQPLLSLLKNTVALPNIPGFAQAREPLKNPSPFRLML